MKFVEAAESPYALPTIELTRRNLETLLLKLVDPASHRTIAKDGYAVHAVEGDEFLPAPELTLIADGHAVTAVEDEDHYADRAAGLMYMPTADEYI